MPFVRSVLNRYQKHIVYAAFLRLTWLLIVPL